MCFCHLFLAYQDPYLLLDYLLSMKLPAGSLGREGSEALEDHKESVGGAWVFQTKEGCDLGGDAGESHTLVHALHI